MSDDALESQAADQTLEPPKPADSAPSFGIDGKAYATRGSFGVVGKVTGAGPNFVELQAPMGHEVRLRRNDVDQALGGSENAQALLDDAKANKDAVTIRFDSTGASYHNTEQLMRFERSKANGETPPFNPTETQRRAAIADERRTLLRTESREFNKR
jgi:hypothetical protein